MKCKSILCHGGGNRFLCKIIILHHKCESEMKHVLHSKLKMPWLAYFFNSCRNSQAAKGGVRDLWISFAHLIRVIIHFFIFMPAFPQWRVRGAAALGGLEIPDGRVITRSKIIFTKRAANELISTLRVINNDTVFYHVFSSLELLIKHSTWSVPSTNCASKKSAGTTLFEIRKIINDRNFKQKSRKRGKKSKPTRRKQFPKLSASCPQWARKIENSCEETVGQKRR